jgi:hypothetical protein
VNRRLLVLATLLALPSVAIAQRGGGVRTKAGMHESSFKDDNTPQGPTLRPRDIEDVSPIKLLLDKRKDLKLSDAQTDGLKKAEGALKEKNAPLLKAVDSLVHEMKPPLNATPESDMRIRDARGGLQQALGTIDENYAAAAKEALATFDADQQAKATAMLAKLKEDADKKIREKMSGGRG